MSGHFLEQGCLERQAHLLVFMRLGKVKILQIYAPLLKTVCINSDNHYTYVIAIMIWYKLLMYKLYL